MPTLDTTRVPEIPLRLSRPGSVPDPLIRRGIALL